MKCWYALYCRSKHEETVRQGLAALGIESFLPTVPVTSHWSDRERRGQKPLFPGYVFGRSTSRDLFLAASVRGVVRILGAPWSGPIPIPDEEIAAVRVLLASGLPVSAESFHEFRIGEPVEIAYGPFVGVRGVVSRQAKGTRLVVAISALQMARSVELDCQCLRPLRQAA